jgi:hypothetical protein
MQGQYDIDTGNDLQTLFINDLTTQKELLRGKYFPDIYAHEIPVIDGWKATQGTASYEPSLVATYNPPEHHWLSVEDAWERGDEWGWGTTMGIYDLVPVKLVFDKTDKQKAYCYLRGGSPSYGYNGYYDVPIRAYNVSDVNNPRQINLAFVENKGMPTQDQTWMPDMKPANSREYLFVLKSDYRSTADPVYTAYNLYTEAAKMDIMYASWLYRESDTLTFHDGDYYFLQPTVPVSYRDTFILNPFKSLTETPHIPLAGGILLGQNYPNPFGAGSPSASFATRLPVALPRRDHVTMKIFDVLGRLVNIACDGILEAGYHEISFYAPPSLPAGLYTAVLTTSTERQAVTMTLLR